MKKVEKKVWPEYFQTILDGKKTFELRLNDFDIVDGDTLLRSTLGENWKEKLAM